MTAETTQQNGQGRDKRYNIEGVISDLVVRQDKTGADWASFKLQRQGDKKPVSCVAFTDKAAKLLASFGEGSEIRLFGYFEKRSFKAEDGQDVRFSRLNVLWSGVPKAQEEAVQQDASETEERKAA